jgi:catechol 2,3-dioxygenase-like lactoylglutathione lyase family enzyme
MSLVDHVSLMVSDYGRSKLFYERVLEPLGVRLLLEVPGWGAFGREPDKYELWIGTGPTGFQTSEQLRTLVPTHVALAARSRSEVDAFHAAALSAGGRDYGPPGMRPQYYAAFVLDLDGNNIEAVFR